MFPAEASARPAVVQPHVMTPAPADGELCPNPALPLWLTEAEVAALVTLCAAGPDTGAPDVERCLFGKMGDLLRAFRR